MYEALNQTMPNHITLNQIMWNQTKACVAKSSCINKRGDRAWLKLTDTIFFLGHCPSSYFGSRPSFHFQTEKHLTWQTPLIELSLVIGHHRNSNLLKYVPTDRSRQRVITGKWLLKIKN